MPNRTRARFLQANDSLPTAISRAAALTEFGPVVYAVLLADRTIKIGYTTDLAARRRKLLGPVSSQRILALCTGTLEDEQAIHRRLKPWRAHSHEYYLPCEEVLTAVNEIRASVGMRPLQPAA